MKEPPLRISGDADRYNYRAGYDDYREVAALFGLFDASQRQCLSSNTTATMQSVPLEIVECQLTHFAQVDLAYAAGVRAAFAPAPQWPVVLSQRAGTPATWPGRLLLHLLAVRPPANCDRHRRYNRGRRGAKIKFHIPGRISRPWTCVCGSAEAYPHATQSPCAGDACSADKAENKLRHSPIFSTLMQKALSLSACGCGPLSGDLKMKTMILATFAALSLGICVANAQSLSHNAAPQQRTGNQHNWLNGGG